ncbi:MAG TPA: DMT family transporter [Luteibaculaceae bacterium]|nr:DMT family transporter [Luteibaculaceae bacterium]
MSYKQSLFMLHLIILIWGFTGILGKVLTDTMSPEVLVWFRMAIGSLSIFLYIILSKPSPWPSGKQVLSLFGIGLIIAIHWLTFFGSIQASNVSIALACLASGSLFTALLEPLFFRKAIAWYELALGLAVLGALLFIFKFETNYQKGILLSVLSAFMASLFTVLNAKQVKKVDAIKVSAFEISSGFIWVTLYLAIGGQLALDLFDMNATEWASLTALGTICTGFAFVMGVVVMKKLSPFTVTLSINLEPIYSIVLAFVFFNEHKYLTPAFFIGALVILATVIINAWVKYRVRAKEDLQPNSATS